MTPIEKEMLRFLYERERSRERFNTWILFVLVVGVIIVGGALVNLYQYRHGWK